MSYIPPFKRNQQKPPQQKIPVYNFAVRLPFPSDFEQLTVQPTEEDKQWLEWSPPHCSIVSLQANDQRLPDLVHKMRDLKNKFGYQQIRLGQREKMGRRGEHDVILIEFVNPEFREEIVKIYSEFASDHHKKIIGEKPKFHMTVRRSDSVNEAVWNYYQPGMELTVSELFYRETDCQKAPLEHFSL